jgi:hypothetical protein
LARVDRAGGQLLGIAGADANSIAMIKYEQVTGIPGTASDIAYTPGFGKSLTWS